MLMFLSQFVQCALELFWFLLSESVEGVSSSTKFHKSIVWKDGTIGFKRQRGFNHPVLSLMGVGAYHAKKG